MKNLWKYVLVALFVTGVVNAGAIKTWVNGDALNANDLNSNFSHIHNLMVGGHGARLVDADVSPNAAIKLSKISGTARIPAGVAIVAGAGVGTDCVADPCGTFNSDAVIAANWVGTGDYILTAAPGSFSGSGTFTVVVTPMSGTGPICVAGQLAVNQFTVKCYAVTAPGTLVAADSSFSVAFWNP